MWSWRYMFQTIFRGSWSWNLGMYLQSCSPHTETLLEHTLNTFVYGLKSMGEKWLLPTVIIFTSSVIPPSSHSVVIYKVLFGRLNISLHTGLWRRTSNSFSINIFPSCPFLGDHMFSDHRPPTQPTFEGLDDVGGGFTSTGGGLAFPSKFS